MYTHWNAPLAGGGTGKELALSFDRGREQRLLMLAPLFDEHNKLRRQIVETMRKLDTAGIDCVLPDLPGTNESPAPLQDQTLTSWREAVACAVAYFRITHVIAIRGGTLLLPNDRPALAYAPVKGRQILRGMLRARAIAAREAGREETTDILLDEGRERGLELAGWHLGAKMIREVEAAEPVSGPQVRVIEQAAIGGSPLWLRAEPGEDAAQAETLAAIVAQALTA